MRAAHHLQAMRRPLRPLLLAGTLQLLVIGYPDGVAGPAPPPGVPVTVSTPLGDVEGLRHQGVDSFKGLPFAEPPVGELRFAPAVLKAPPGWGGVRAAHEYGHECLQGDLFGGTLDGDEDCLLLNLWRPAAPDPHAGGLPVMFWI